MALMDSSSIFNFKYAIDDVFEAASNVVKNLKDFDVNSIDKNSYSITLMGKMSLFSWGEILTICMNISNSGMTEVSISSQPKIGSSAMGSGIYGDMGKNSKNVIFIKNEITKELLKYKENLNGLPNQNSKLDEIKKLKELLDIGAITKEEFDNKKSELLLEKAVHKKSLIKCNDCGKEISAKAKTCIHCGCPVEKENLINEQTNIDKENITIAKEDEMTKNFVDNSSEEFTITNDNINDDMQTNIDSQILEKEKILSKKDKEIDELQKEKSSFIENNTHLLEEIKNKEKSLSEKDKEINELQKKLETVKNNNQELSKKIKNEKAKERKEIKEKLKKNSINVFVRIINFVRYCIFLFFTLGFIVNIFQFNISMLYLFFMFAIPFPPFIYKMLFKKIKLSLKKQILIQILSPITFMLFGIITWGLMFNGG